MLSNESFKILVRAQIFLLENFTFSGILVGMKISTMQISNIYDEGNFGPFMGNDAIVDVNLHEEGMDER